MSELGDGTHFGGCKVGNSLEIVCDRDRHSLALDPLYLGVVEMLVFHAEEPPHGSPEKLANDHVGGHHHGQRGAVDEGQRVVSRRDERVQPVESQQQVHYHGRVVHLESVGHEEKKACGHREKRRVNRAIPKKGYQKQAGLERMFGTPLKVETRGRLLHSTTNDRERRYLHPVTRGDKKKPPAGPRKSCRSRRFVSVRNC